MRVTILASGSKGNASLYEAGGTRVLVDAGITLAALCDWVPRVDAIVITHAHSDHVGHYARLARRMRARVYMSEATARAVEASDEVVRYSPREPFAVGAITVSPTPLPHDAAQVGLVLSDGASRVGLATDLGEIPPGLLGHFRGCDALLLESNHDIEMLIKGPYRDFLKKRIASARGHLSNDQACEFLRAHFRDARAQGETGARSVTLMHLSEQNNLPDLAYEQAREVVEAAGARLTVASQTEALDLTVEPSGQLALF